MGKAPKATKTETTDAQYTDTCRCGCGETVNRFFRQGHDQRLISKLAADVVEGTGTGLGILPAADAELDIQARIDRVAEYAKLSEALGRKFHSAAMNSWASYQKRTTKQAATVTEIPFCSCDLNRTKGVHQDGCERELAGQMDPTERDHEVAEQILTQSDQDDDNLSTADPRELAGEAPADQVSYALGAPVKVKVGRYVYDGFVHGMNQAGKVTAVRYTNKAGKDHTLAAPKQINLV